VPDGSGGRGAAACQTANKVYTALERNWGT